MEEIFCWQPTVRGGASLLYSIESKVSLLGSAMNKVKEELLNELIEDSNGNDKKLASKKKYLLGIFVLYIAFYNFCGLPGLFISVFLSAIILRHFNSVNTKVKSNKSSLS